MSREGEEKSGFRLVDKLVGTHRLVESMKILTRSIRIPIDAATRRTPESEEEPMIKQLVIPSGFEVRRLIEEAQNLERVGKQCAFYAERDRAILLASSARTKAITLHLGIEEAR